MPRLVPIGLGFLAALCFIQAAKWMLLAANDADATPVAGFAALIVGVVRAWAAKVAWTDNHPSDGSP
jgi:hypothetical protein